MFGRLAPRERNASRKLVQKAKGVKFFILGIASSFKFHAFLASDKHSVRLLLKCLNYSNEDKIFLIRSAKS